MILPYVATALLAIVALYSAIVSFRPPAASAQSPTFPQAISRLQLIVVGILTLALVAGLVSRLVVGARNRPQRASRFLISEGYTGWVRVEFEVPGTPPLPTEASQYVLSIPAGGVLRTSSPEQYGWARDHYFYSSPQGVRSLPDSGPAALIWGKINGEASGASGRRKYEEFFVGTFQQFKDQAK